MSKIMVMSNIMNFQDSDILSDGMFEIRGLYWRKMWFPSFLSNQFFTNCHMEQKQNSGRVFHWFSINFHGFSIGFHWFSLVFHRFSLVFICFSLVFHWFSCVFQCIHRFPLVFILFYYGFLGFLRFSYAFLMDS